MTKRLIANSLFALLFTFAPLFCFGDSLKPPSFNEYRLTVGDKVGSKVIEDFNSDGLKDILITEERKASLFLQDSESGFLREPNQTWEFDPNVVLFDVGDISDRPGKELVCMTADEVFYHPFRDGKLISTEKVTLVELQTIVDRLGGTTLRRKDFLIDLDKDGDDDLIVPRAGQYSLFRQEANGLLKPMAEINAEIASQILIPENASLFRVISAFQIPKIVLGDFNGDGKGDIVLRRDDALAVFSEDEKGALSKQSTLIMKSNDRKENRRRVLAPTMQSEVQDANNDGVLDVIVSDNSSVSPRAKRKRTIGTVKIYLSPGLEMQDRGELDQPSQIVRWKDRYVLGTRLSDLNNDGLDDLGVLTMKRLGLWGVIKILISRKLKFRLYVFLQRPESPGRTVHASKLPYPTKPDLKRDITAPFVLRRTPSEIKLGSPLLLTLDGDFNGDGRKDWVYKDKPDRLSFYFGTEKKEIFKKKRDHKQKIMDTSSYQFVASVVDDLNDDAISDLILHYQGWDDEKDALNVILSMPEKSHAE